MLTRLGIVGAGQLALYLCEAAHALGREVAVLALPGDAPALRYADRSFRYTDGNSLALEGFLAHCDVVTFDKEALPDDLVLRIAAAERQGRIAARPGTGTLQLLNDKALQKSWLVDQGLPTLPFVVTSGNNIPVGDVTAQLGPAVVQKARRGGYDGRGVQILARLHTSGQLWDLPGIIEPYLPDCRELSVIVARTRSGEVQAYPPVSMEFDPRLNTVSIVTMPALITPLEQEAAIDLATRAIDALEGVGIFAVEMFLTAGGKLLVNEISPRVHNSGHITLDACNVSQFEQHVRAVLDMPLAAVDTFEPAAMVNILESQDLCARFPSEPAAVSYPETAATLYWYGKSRGRPGRKMGHINVLTSSADEALQIASEALARLSCGGTGSSACRL